MVGVGTVTTHGVSCVSQDEPAVAGVAHGHDCEHGFSTLTQPNDPPAFGSQPHLHLPPQPGVAVVVVVVLQLQVVVVVGAAVVTQLTLTEIEPRPHEV